MATALQEPKFIPSTGGEAYWWAGGLAEILATPEDTNGGFTLVAITVQPGFATPLHIHHDEDEGFYILEGSATFTVGDEVIEAGVGDYAYGPRDIKHMLEAGPEGCKMLYLFTPGGFEGFIRAAGVRAPRREAPDPQDVDVERLVAAAPQYGLELLG